MSRIRRYGRLALRLTGSRSAGGSSALATALAESLASLNAVDTGGVPLATFCSVFFEPPPAEPEPEPVEPPPWAGPPETELGTVVPMRAVLAFGTGVAIAMTDCVAFSTGFEIGFTVKAKEPIDVSSMFHHPRHRPGKPLPDDLLRIGVQFADGRKGTSVGHPGGRQFADYMQAKREGREAEMPPGPLLMMRGGGGGGRSWQQRFWVWPLPPEGSITIACEWPAMGVTLTTHALDAGEIRRAARTSRKLWD